LPTIARRNIEEAAPHDMTGLLRTRTGWYAKYGFVPLQGAAESGPQRMFLDIRTVRAALRS
jgi:hypothetical protein